MKIEVADPWPTPPLRGSAAALLNRVKYTPGSTYRARTLAASGLVLSATPCCAADAAFPSPDTYQKESWVRNANKESRYAVQLTPTKTEPVGPYTSSSLHSTFGGSFSMPLNSPPERLDRCVRAWPDPHTAAVRPYMLGGDTNTFGKVRVRARLA